VGCSVSQQPNSEKVLQTYEGETGGAWCYAFRKDAWLWSEGRRACTGLWIC